LVLIPDKEDPDSYVNKVGASAFNEFVRSNRKDFILFQLDVALKDAADDTTKKSEVVNSIAETISKINKAEDFTKQQDYIKQCSEILKIDESGLHALVNKFIREKITSQGKKIHIEEAKYYSDVDIAEPIITDWSAETFILMHRDILQEQGIVRVLLEHGEKPWDNEKKVADFIFEQNIDDDLFEDRSLLNLMTDYKKKHYSGSTPSLRHYTSLTDSDFLRTVINITNFPYEVSSAWVENFNSGIIKNSIWYLPVDDFLGQIIKFGEINPDIYDKPEEDNYRELVDNVMDYLKLRKLRHMILLNQKDFQLPHTDSEIIELIHVHNHLKEEQMKIGRKRGIVIYPA